MRLLSLRPAAPDTLWLLQRVLETREKKHTYVPKCWQFLQQAEHDGIRFTLHRGKRPNHWRILAHDVTTNKTLSLKKVKNLICELEIDATLQS